MSREQLASHEAQHGTANHEVEAEEASDLPPSILWRAKALGPGDGEALKMLLRQYPELMVEIGRVVAHPMGNSAVNRVIKEMTEELAASSIGPARRASADTIDGSDPQPRSAGELRASDHAVIAPARRESADTIYGSPPNTTPANPAVPSSAPRQWRFDGNVADVAPARRAPAEGIEGSGPDPMAPPSWARGKDTAPDHAVPSHQAGNHEFDAETSAPLTPAVEGPGHGRVKVLGLNVRSSPHAGSRDNLIGSLRRGEQIEISGRDGAWLQITYKGQPAFVHSQHVEVAKKPLMTEQLSPAPQTSAVQRTATAPTSDTSQGVHAAAERGIAGSASRLPFAEQIQRAFGHHDISAIQAHSDRAAAASAGAMGAQAFATGNHVAFAGTPNLHTAAHEAAHVVQQRGGVQLKGGVGVVGDSYERHADAVADLVVQGKSASGLLDAMASGASGPSTPAVQRAPKPSHYGTFTDEKYEINASGLDMTLKFTPNDEVDATKIGLSQTARPTIAGNQIAIDPNIAKRLGPDGAHIDRLSDKNTPVYGSENLSAGKGLSDTKETNNTSANPTELNPDNGRNATYALGHRFKVGEAWNIKDAGLYDRPTIQGSNNSSSEFETTAVALDGVQKGEFYGSVKWGWKKDGAGTLSKLDFDVVSMGVPSKNFLAAATKWNAAKARGTMTPVANATKVFDGALAEKFTIDTGVDAILKSSASAGDIVYAFIEFTTGAHAGDSGYVKVTELKDKGDGAQTVDLPTPTITVVTGQTPLYADDLQKTRLQSLARNVRVKVLASKGMVKQIQIVDGTDTGKMGWISANKLANEA